MTLKPNDVRLTGWVTVCLVATSLSLAFTPIAAQQAGDAQVATYQAAMEALLDGRYRDASRLFTKASEEGAPTASAMAVRALIVGGDYERAAAEARAHTRRTPDDSWAWLVLGEALVARGELSEARSAFERAASRPGRDSLLAELQLGMLEFDRGDRAAALARFDGFIDAYNSPRGLSSAELTAVATAARYLGINNHQLFQDALRVYGEAIAVDSTNMDARVAIGELLLEKYNNAEALPAFVEALEVSPKHPAALLGMAKSLHFDGKPLARETAEQSLESNPNFVPARAFLARLHLELEAYDEAVREAERALEVNPASLEALAVLAAAHYLAGDRAAFEATEARVVARNAAYAELYNTLAELSARNRLYAAAAEFAKRAVELDETSWRGYGLLGLNQLRIGLIEEGRAHLDTSFAGDPYNVWIKNTLDLTDTFDEYTVTRAGHFEFMVRSDESPLLGLYLADLAEEAYEKLAVRYQHQPPTPVRIEVYPRHADFSVRTVGLAGMGALGVSFGPVIAMDSPSARRLGEFNWGTTLWHELAHTFHLSLSDNRVPRWFSEGLAVHEERQAREGWGGDVTPGFLNAYREGRLLPVSQLNNGFVRPTYPQQVIHSYYQASLVFDLIEREWGFQAVRDMLSGYRRGWSNAEVFERVLDMTLAQFDDRFDLEFKTRFTGALVALSGGGHGDPSAPVEAVLRAQNEPNDFVAQLTAGRVLYEQGRQDEAAPYFERAQELFPDYAGTDSPYTFLAKIYREKDMIEDAADQLRRQIAINENHYTARVDLSELLIQLGDTTGAAETLTGAMFISPFDPGIHVRLAVLHEELGRWSDAIRERRAVVALDPVDIAEARYHLAAALYRGANLREARREVLKVLEQAPNYRAAQELLLEIRRSS